MKANSNQAVLTTLARARRRHGRRQRRRTAARARRGRARREDHLLRRRQDAGRDEPRARREHPVLQRRIGAGTRGAVGVASARGAVAPIAIRVNPDVDARTHAKIATGKSENKFGVPISRAREVYARARSPARPRRPRRRHAYRLADHRSRAVRRRLRAARRFRAGPARRRARDRPCRSRRRPRHSLPQRQRSAALPGGNMPSIVAQPHARRSAAG